MPQRFGLLCFFLFAPIGLAADEKPAALTAAEQEVVRQAVWGTPEARAKALAELRRWPETSERVRQIEDLIRAGRIYAPIADRKQTLVVPIGGERKLNVFVQLPS